MQKHTEKARQFSLMDADAPKLLSAGNIPTEPALWQPTEEDSRRHYSLGFFRHASLLTTPIRKIPSLWRRPKRALMVTGAVATITLAALAGLFLWPGDIAFSYSQPTCFFNPVILPAKTATAHNEPYTIAPQNSITIGSNPIFATHSCVHATAAPKSRETTRITLGFINHDLLRKKVHIHTKEAPKARLTTNTDHPIPTTGTIDFHLRSPDIVFGFQLTGNKRAVQCTKTSDKVSCPVEKLALAQSKEYDLTLVRTFQKKLVNTVLIQRLKTVEALRITSASMKQNEHIYSVPNELRINTNKSAITAQNLALNKITNGKKEQITTTVTTDKSTIIVRFTKPLPRLTQFELTITTAIASDDARLENPYHLSFTTSGGPKVRSTSLASYGVQPSSRFTLSFDVAPDAAQLRKFISISTSAGAASFTLSSSGRFAYITPTLSRCQAFTVKVADGLPNTYGITGGSAWSFSSRTICQETFSIGTSVQGRSIVGYKFGNGSTKIVFIGAMHGNERSASYTLISLVDDLEQNYHRLAGKTVYVIPTVNPDGFATNSRLNANGVDLNRNFPTSNWKSNVTLPGGKTQPGGGGETALSEPESKAIANFVLAKRPKLLLTYHGQYPLVSANESGNSRSLATTYGNLAGIPSYGLEANKLFTYDTTGALEDWMHQAYDLPALLIELRTKTSNEFTRQRSAIWAVL